jgi:hypothetical protein
MPDPAQAQEVVDSVMSQTPLVQPNRPTSVSGPSPHWTHLENALKWVCLILCGALIGVAAAIEPMIALLVVMGILVLPWAISNIHLVVLLIAVYTPFEEFVLKWMPGSLAGVLRFAPEGLIILLLAALVLRNLGRGTLWKRTPIDLPILLFLAFSGLSAIANDVPIAVWILGIREFARYVLLYYLVVNSGLTGRFMKLLVVVLLLAAGLEASLGLLQAFLGNRFGRILVSEPVYVSSVMVRPGFSQILSGSTRIFGTLGRYERFGLFMTMFLLLGLGLCLSLGSGLRRRIWLGFAGLAMLLGPALALSFSRTSWFVVYAGTVVAFLIKRSKRILLLLIVIPVLATMVLLSWTALESWEVAKTEEASVTERFAATFSRGYIEVLLKRGRLFALGKVSPIILREYTWLGLGPGTIGSIATGGGTNSPGLLPEYSHEDWLDVSEVGRADSLALLHDVGWVSILAQVGVLGLLAYGWIIFELAVVALRCYRDSAEWFVRGFALGYLALLAAVLLANFAMFSFSYRISMYVWLFGGMLTLFYTQLRETSVRSGGRPSEARAARPSAG